MITETIDLPLKKELAHLFTNQRENIDKAVRALKLFAHPDRLKLLCVFCSGGEFTVKQLESYTGIRQSTVSQHLSLLKDRAVVTSRREGNFSLYQVANDDVMEMFDLIKRIYCK